LPLQFRPLYVAKPALEIEDPKYHQSWVESGGSSGQAFSPPTS
jgi:hypothetical protein